MVISPRCIDNSQPRRIRALFSGCRLPGRRPDPGMKQCFPFVPRRLRSGCGQPTPPQIRSDTRGVTAPESWDVVWDTKRSISHAIHSLKRFLKANRNLLDPSIDPADSMGCPVQVVKFIRGGWVPRQQVNFSCITRHIEVKILESDCVSRCRHYRCASIAYSSL
jgi:hypothetical protein